MVASLFDKKANRSSLGIEVLRAGAHAGISGTSSVLQGGSFYQGALTGALSSSFSSAASAVGGTEGDMVVAGVFGGAVGSALNGDNFMKSFVRGFSIGMFNHGLHSGFSPSFKEIVLEIAKQKGWDLNALKEYLALVVGESTAGNFSEAQAISEVTTLRMELSGTSLTDKNWYAIIHNKFGDYDANNGNNAQYNGTIGKSLSQVLSSNFRYAPQVRGAFIGHVANYGVSGGALYFNATTQRYSKKDIGYNWKQFNNGNFVISATVGKTTFFR